MNNSILNKLKHLRSRYEEIEVLLTQKDIIKNKDNLKTLSQEYLKLSETVQSFIAWEKLEVDIDNIHVLLNDIDMQDIAKEELYVLNKKKEKARKKKLIHYYYLKILMIKIVVLLKLEQQLEEMNLQFLRVNYLECILDMPNLIYGKSKL